MSSSYRPISLLSIISKSPEKSLLPYITAQIPNTFTQHWYMAHHSTRTVTALHTLNKTVVEGVGQRAPPARPITVTLDMSKIFDTINIHTLIIKPIQTKIPGTFIQFIANYINAMTMIMANNSFHTTYKYTYSRINNTGQYV